MQIYFLNSYLDILKYFMQIITYIPFMFVFRLEYMTEKQLKINLLHKIFLIQ
jgi:hypothetical protein